MRNFGRYVLYAACYAFIGAALVSCVGKASVKGSLPEAPDSEVIVKLLDINRYEVLDTVRTDADGNFFCKVEVRKGQPEFVYLFYGDTKIASLLLRKGDRVTVEADTLGTYTVSGSEESEKLLQVEKDLAEFSSRFISLSAMLEAADQASPQADTLRRELAQEYVGYYRGRLKYVMSNPYSMTVVPVLFQMVGANLPVFGQQTDAIHFSNVSDSLETVYPESRYVKALRQEADRRYRMMEMSNKIRTAEQVNYLDIDQPDVRGVKRKLSEVDSKVVLLHFWDPAQPAQKMFNNDVLKPLYDRYSGKGLEIYQVAISTDKAGWARVVREQGLEWINVCDGLGASSPAVSAYNVSTLPVSFVLSGGELQQERMTDAASLRKVLDRLLK